MIYTLNDPMISSLKRGEFAIPDLNWDTELPLIVGGDGSVQAMATNMEANGYAILIDEVRQNVGYQFGPNEVIRLIQEEIQNNDVESLTDDQLEKIFHLIQLWGGKSARQFYFQNTILNVDAYRDFIRSIIIDSEENDPEETLDCIMNSLETLISATDQFNISFATKHVNLWQYYGGSHMVLPIYDNIMALNVMGRFSINKKDRKLVPLTTNRFKDLRHYWTNMKLAADELGIDISTLERNLFNFFRSGTPESWPRFVNIKFD
ncbi:hypothetical protein [Robiginitalea aurantiaca]|uniref:Uncharacterized protein n=1 Tax=Robiginitalea aurantiaca TaxID=3056915 RepID=A0ABT7WBE9_9FLAO|nr:hypothetical protein [Robiginitalea aurantiaca]MDM9630243.1 hypothetical protein [Robiginitalea aurantiaca]